MDQIISKELRVYGSHGIQSMEYKKIFEMIQNDEFNPEILIGEKIVLSEVPDKLANMDNYTTKGITVIDRFDTNEKTKI